MRINLHFENDGMPETAEAWLLDLLSRRSIHSVKHSTLTARGEQLPLSVLGPETSDFGGVPTSLLQILCTSILRTSLWFDVFNGDLMGAVEQPISLKDLKVAESAEVKLELEGGNRCQVSISFSLER